MKGYKTLIFNSAVTLLPAVDFVINNGALLAPMIGPNGGVVLSILGGINIILRALTDSPIMSKGDK